MMYDRHGALYNDGNGLLQSVAAGGSFDTVSKPRFLRYTVEFAFDHSEHIARLLCSRPFVGLHHRHGSDDWSQFGKWL